MYRVKKELRAQERSETVSWVYKKKRQEERNAKAGKVRSVCLPFPLSLTGYVCSWLWKGETLPGQEKEANTSDVM